MVDSNRCEGCYLNFFDAIKLFYKDDPKAILAFKQHSVLPDTVLCPKCSTNCNFAPSSNCFFCRRTTKDSKSRKIKCSFSVSINKNTWLDRSHMTPSQNIVFCSLFLQKSITQRQAVKWLKIGHETAVNWKRYCYEVCEFWLAEQEQLGIGGPGKIVEIGENLFGKVKNNRRQWVFGCLERVSKRRLFFLVEKRDAETLVPIIKKHILPGTTIYSDSWQAYDTLSDEGYTHNQTDNHADEKVSATCEDVHTRNIEQCWGDLKSWILRSGNKKILNHKYLSKYMFCKAFHEEERLHHFLETIAKMYRHPNI